MLCIKNNRVSPSLASMTTISPTQDLPNTHSIVTITDLENELFADFPENDSNQDVLQMSYYLSANSRVEDEISVASTTTTTMTTTNTENNLVPTDQDKGSESSINLSPNSFYDIPSDIYSADHNPGLFHHVMTDLTDSKVNPTQKGPSFTDAGKKC